MPDRPGPPIALRIAHGVCALVTIGGGGASVLGWFGGVWWRLDLFSHFRVQYVVALLPAMVWWLAWRRWWKGAATGAVLAFNVVLVAPLYLSSSAPADPDAPRLELMLFNVHHGNDDPGDVIDYLRDTHADVIVVLETTRSWTERLGNGFPAHSITGESRQDPFGIALLTRRAPVHSRVVRLAGSDLPAVEAVIEHRGQRFAILAVHPPPPLTADLASMRDRIIAAVGDWAREWKTRTEHGPIDHIVVAGDLNATPWSHAMRRLDDRSELRSSLSGFGVQPTWPRDSFLLRIPIDHVLHSPSLTTVARTVGPFLGSDHRPVRVALAPAGR